MSDDEPPEVGKTPDGLLTVGRKGTEVLDTTSTLDDSIVASDLPIEELISTSARDTTELSIT